MMSCSSFKDLINRVRPQANWRAVGVSPLITRARKNRRANAHRSPEAARTNCAIILAILLVATPLSAAETVDFNRDIRPILSNHCFACHGPDAKKREAELRLDQRAAATAKAESGKTPIVPGDLKTSELVRRITAADADDRMPPADGGKPLSAKQIELLQHWVAEGADYDQHWAFVAPVRPAVPEVKKTDWPQNEIDQFVLARLEREGIAPADEADRETLIRRVALDLTGLPPTLAEIDKFCTDNSPRAYEDMVDRYLDSPAYGEHMAAEWLDLARYADSNGYQYDTERQQWVWRDWVIAAYNRNMPFDQFTVEQLAGDLLPDATPQQRLATGFNRNHGITIEGGVIDEEYRVEYVMDRVVTTGTVWLGLTIGCCRCHDHKFDPISQREFYQVFAMFNQVPERGNSGFAPQEKIPSPLADMQHQQIDEQIARLRAQLDRPADQLDAEVARWAEQIAASPAAGWQVLKPTAMNSSGGSKFTALDDDSLLVGGANPNKDVYEITARTDQEKLTAVRLECLTHESLPGGGPGRHTNSNFVLSEFELVAVSTADPTKREPIKFVRAIADYSQANYEIAKAIDGTVAGNNGWAVDGPTRKEPATAIFFASKPFGFAGGTELQFRLRHEAGFATHGIGRPRLSISSDDPAKLTFDGIPGEILRIAKKSAGDRAPEEASALREYYQKTQDAQRKAILAQIAELEQREAAAFPATMIMQDMPQPRATFVLNRGQYNEPTERVEPGVPAIFPPLPDDVPQNRLAFARWLVDPAHPLTARVAVNRYWQRLFGIGLVKTMEDFGVQGELPSHPELLDWLATEFVESGWDVKHMLRLIVTSATYRQSSHADAGDYGRDPQNRLLAHGPRVRLSAEQIRDSALAVSGLLVQQLGGRSVYPYQPDGLWLELNNRPGYSKKYQRGSGNDLYRRSLYTFWKRTVPSPMLKTLDAPEREFCTVERSRTNTPLQSLLLLNGPQFVEAARHLGRRMIVEGGASVDDRIALGFRLVTARPPDAAERAIFRQAYQSNLTKFQSDPAAAAKLLEVGDSPCDPSLDAAEYAAWTSVARLLMNLDEFVTKE